MAERLPPSLRPLGRPCRIGLRGSEGANSQISAGVGHGDEGPRLRRRMRPIFLTSMWISSPGRAPLIPLRGLQAWWRHSTDNGNQLHVGPSLSSARRPTANWPTSGVHCRRRGRGANGPRNRLANLLPPAQEHLALHRGELPCGYRCSDAHAGRKSRPERPRVGAAVRTGPTAMHTLVEHRR